MNDFNQVQTIDREIENLVNQRANIKEAIFNKASKNWLDLLNVEFESSTGRTPEYLKFCRVFKSQFRKLLNANFLIKRIEFFKPNHFDAGGFFELTNGNIYYFHIGDLRWDKSFLIRTAESFKDYTGGSNNMLNTAAIEPFMDGLRSVVK